MVSELPRLPTDNLYKFMSIGGLILILYSMVIYKQHNEYEAQVLELQANNEILKTEQDWVKTDISLLNNEITELSKEFDIHYVVYSGDPGAIISMMDKINNAKNKEDLKKDFKEGQSKIDILKSKVTTLENSLRETTKNELKNKAQIEKIRFLKNSIYQSKIASLILFGTGLLVSIIGFSLWYFRHQVYKDKLLKSLQQ